MFRRWAALLVAPTVALLAGCTVVVEPKVDTPPAAPLFAEPTSRVLDAANLDQGVQSVLENDYKINVESVICPPDEVVQVGNNFDCQALIDGENKQVTVTVKTIDGQYEVGQPQ